MVSISLLYVWAGMKYDGVGDVITKARIVLLNCDTISFYASGVMYIRIVVAFLRR